jgi:SurA N-terminal domain
MNRTSHPSRLRLVRRALAVAVAGLLATGALGACSPDQLGAAAVIDGERITSQQLQQATREYLAAVNNPDDSKAQGQILQQMILSRVVARAAKKLGVGVRTGTVARQRDQVLQNVGGARVALVQALAQQAQTTVAPSQIDQWVRYRLRINRIITKLDPGGDPTSQVAADKLRALLVKTNNEMDIQVNPRYGTWSPTRGIQPLLSGGLSQTVAQLS